MTIAVDLGRKATKTKQQQKLYNNVQELPRVDRKNLLKFFCSRFYIPVNNYGHVERSVHLTTLFPRQA